MRHNMIPNIEALETRLAPALAIYGIKATPTPTLANLKKGNGEGMRACSSFCF